MFRRRALAAATIFVACVLSGALECSQSEQTAPQQRGAYLYGRMCSVCHGANGEGYKADQAPALAHAAFLASASDEFLHAAIAGGRKRTTMSAWGAERGGPLSNQDVNALVAFIRLWGREGQATLDERRETGDPTRGADVFARECARCHGASGTGGPYINIGNPQLLSSASNGFLRYAMIGGRAGTGMPSFGATLGVGAVDDILALLRLWQAMPPSVPPPAPAPVRPPPIPLGPVPLNARGPEPAGFSRAPATTSADAIKGQLDRGAKMVLLDARAPSDYTTEHIAGAVSVPFYDPDPYFDALPKDAWLVCYCACPHAESGQLAQKLVNKGFPKVTVLDEGLGFWKNKKYAVHTGSLP